MRGRTFFIACANTPVLVPNHEFAKEDILDCRLSTSHEVKDDPGVAGDLTSPVNMCHCIPKEVSRVRTRERNAHCFYRFWLIYLRLRVSPRGVRTQSRSVNSPRSYHWAMEAVGDGPKLRIFIVAIWPNFRKYLERREFKANQGRGNFHLRNFSRPNPTSVETRPSAFRIVNVNSISTQLNFRYLYYICVRAF